MDAIDAYLAHLVDVVEGGTYTDDDADHGGPTRWGITQKTLAKWRGTPVTPADVQKLTRETALEIYRAWYVTAPEFDRLVPIAAGVALEVIDTGINMGPIVATRYLQRSLNVLGASPMLVIDGNCGPKTAAALQAFVTRREARGVSVLVTALNCLQGGDYIRIAESEPAQAKWVYGWLNQRVFQSLSDWACHA